MRGLVGVVYPIPEDLKDRLFDGKPKVFIKYLARNATRLVPGHKVIFYASHGSKKIVGEGVVEKVEFLTPAEVIARYRDRLFLSEEEFYAYVRRSPTRSDTKRMLTLALRVLKKYPRPIGYNKPLTMAGQYLQTTEYRSLMRELGDS